MVTENQPLTKKTNKNLLISRCEKPICIFNQGSLKYLIMHKCYFYDGNLVKLKPEEVSMLVYCTGKMLPSIFKHYRRAIQDDNNKLLNFTVPTFDGESIPLFMLVGCGKCSFCQYKRTSALQVRALCESITSETRPISILLTYNDHHKPKSGVSKSDIQKFLKRLRFHLSADFRSKGYKDNLRYFVCGEYGSDTQRPHYHMILWNFPHQLVSSSGNKWFFYKDIKDYITPIWSFGHTSVKYTDDGQGSSTQCGVKYAVKYLNKETNIPFYDKVIEDDFGNITLVRMPQNKPFILFSRGGRNGRQGLGSQWLKENEDVVIRHNAFNGKYTWCHNGETITSPIPKYFIDKLYPRISNIIPKHIRDKFAALQRCIPFLLIHEDKFEVKGFDSLLSCLTHLNTKYWFLPQCDTHTHYFHYQGWLLDQVLFAIDDLVKYTIPAIVNRTIIETRDSLFTRSMTEVLKTSNYTDLGTTSIDEYFAIRSYYNYNPKPLFPDGQ